MQAWHVRAREPSPRDHMGMERFTLDALFVPDAEILIGFSSNGDSMSGGILSYPAVERGSCAGFGSVLSILMNGRPIYTGSNAPTVHIKRIKQLVEGPTNVRGEVVGSVDLTDEQVQAIRRNYRPALYEVGKAYHYQNVRWGKDFKFAGSTDHLVQILTSSFP